MSERGLPEASGAFGGFIGPKNLLELVRSTAPYLFGAGAGGHLPPAPGPPEARLEALGHDPRGWWAILRAADRLPTTHSPTPAQRTDYFALCAAAHFASVATFVPTDVDTKIRGHLWLDQPADERARMLELAASIARWDVRPVSARIVDVEGLGPVSGHDGEALSIACAGLLAHRLAKDEAGAKRLEEQVAAELDREARAFDQLARQPGRERDLLVLAASITHNAGDVDQGLSGAASTPRGGHHAAAPRERFGRLAHERFERFGGAFLKAKALYKELMSAEGHRNYPLRETKLLRQDPALLLPVGPFLDEWGATLARHPGWTGAQRAEVLAAIVRGVKRVKGQQGYFRALAGFDRAHPGGLDGLAAHLPANVKSELRAPELRKLIAVTQGSFEASLAKRARAILATKLK